MASSLDTRKVRRCVCGVVCRIARPRGKGILMAGVFLSMVSLSPADSIRIAGKPCELAITEVTSNTLRITLAQVGEPVPSDGVLARRKWPRPALQTVKLDAPRTVAMKELRVTISPSPLKIAIHAAEGKRIQELVIDEQSGAIAFDLGKGKLFGLGSGGRQFDRRKGVYPMQCLGADQLDKRDGAINGHRLPIPLLISTDGWSLFVRYPYPRFDLRGALGICAPQPGKDAVPLDVFVSHTEEPAELLDEYTQLTGRPSLPPLWALGYFQSHRTLAGPEEVLSVAKTFRRKELPCDGLIYLGTGFCPSGWNLGHDSFVINTDTFPNPKEMIDQLHEQNFRVILHTTQPPEGLHGHIPARPDETIDANHIASYWSRHQPVARLGIDGWWPDTGQSLSVKAKMARLRMYYQGQLADRPGLRPLAIYENVGYSGMQRYGAWSRTGDTVASWEALQAQVPNLINASLSGVPYISSCPGGFYPSPELDGELYARWFQFNAFTPYFQSHGRTWHTRLPWGWNTGKLGPQEGGHWGEPKVSELRNPAIEPICRKYLHLRYQLLPYLYTLSRETNETGIPILRALWLHYPADPEAVQRGDQYLWGRDILVAPVTEKGASKRKVYLPSGRWYDFWTERRHEGGREIERAIDLETMPLYVRAGGIIPLAPVRQHTAEPVHGPLEVVVHPGDDGSFIMYEDDGRTYDFRDGDYCQTRFTWDDSAGRLTIEPAGGQRPTQYGDMVVRRVGERVGHRVEYAGEPVHIALQ